MVLGIITIIILLFLLLPVLIIVPMSFSSSKWLEFPPPGFSTQWYEKFFGSAQWTGALKVSIEVGVIATVLALVFGVFAALGLHKSNFKGKGIVTELFMMPMLVPAIIVGMAIYRFESKTGISGSLLGLVVAHTLLAIPFVIRTVLSSLGGINPNLELAARSLGANPAMAFLKVTLPGIRSAIFSGGMFAFATSFDEIVVTQFIAGIRVTTVPKQIWDGLKQQLDPTITAISSIVIVGISLGMVALNHRSIFPKKINIVREDGLEEE
jgi:putative spermidine/putrescine transport system permease protein